MKEDVNLEVGEDNRKDQLGKKLQSGKRMKQQQICRMVIYDLRGQRKEASKKGKKGKNEHEFHEGIQANNYYKSFYERNQ